MRELGNGDGGTREMSVASNLLQALMDPGASPQGPSPVEMIETHISFIFFAGGYAYKVKKPVDYGFLDFTTLEKRRHFCEREVELNRRICPEVYLGVDEIREEAGRYAVGGPGQTVEYAVKMRRLPPENSMRRLLQEGAVSVPDVERIAARIARFHRQADAGPRITAFGDLRAVRQNVEENFAQTREFVGKALSRDVYDDLAAYSRALMEVRGPLFQARAEEGRIRDCHGDLHTAQIFLETPAEDGAWDGVSIIDCIEFNERFRCSDVAEDIAFLAMDLDFHGRPDLSRAFVAAYARESGDRGVFELLTFFKAYRAYVRGKVACFCAEDAHLTAAAREEALETARAYFNLAHSYLPALSSPTLILMSGVTGTGKSTLASELSRRWAMEHISSDLVRKDLAGIGPIDRRYESFQEGIYSPQFSARTYDAMIAEAGQQLLTGKSVILDGTFRRADERTKAVDVARGMGADCWIVQCVLDEAEARRRLEKRAAEDSSPSDGRWELYHLQLQQWEAVAEAPANRYIVLYTGGSTEEVIAALLRELYAGIV